MMKWSVLVVSLGVSLCVGFPEPQTPTHRFLARRQATVDLGYSIQEFGLDIAAESWDTSAALMFSPMSVASMLSLLLRGVSGSSYDELREALFISPHTNEATIHNSFGNLLKGLSDEHVILTFASRLFLQQGTSIDVRFTADAMRNYNSTVRTLDFRNRGQLALSRINGWIKRATNNKIKKLLSQPLSPQTTFVAANALYFNGAWETQFPLMNTRDAPFSTGTANITVSMMRNTMSVLYKDIPELNAEMISLPYKGGQFAMFILMPKGQVSLRSLMDLELSLDAHVLNHLVNSMTNTSLTVGLPKMRINHKFSLKNDLQKLDVTSIFDPRTADFGRLAINNHVWVGDMLHETLVEITETGTEAAAATAVSLNRIGSSKRFEVNRPSIIFIRHLSSGVPLFWGRVTDPQPVA